MDRCGLPCLASRYVIVPERRKIVLSWVSVYLGFVVVGTLFVPDRRFVVDLYQPLHCGRHTIVPEQMQTFYRGLLCIRGCVVVFKLAQVKISCFVLTAGALPQTTYRGPMDVAPSEELEPQVRQSSADRRGALEQAFFLQHAMNTSENLSVCFLFYRTLTTTHIDHAPSISSAFETVSHTYSKPCPPPRDA